MKKIRYKSHQIVFEMVNFSLGNLKCTSSNSQRLNSSILDNLLGISWVDSSLVPILNPGNVLDYFSERSNPFYDRTCNNEVVKMQRLTLEHLKYVCTTLRFQTLSNWHIYVRLMKMVFWSQVRSEKTLLCSVTFAENVLYFCLLFSQMVGVEYILLHAQEPILYIIRKQQRQSPAQGEQLGMNKSAASV